MKILLLLIIIAASWVVFFFTVLYKANDLKHIHNQIVRIETQLDDVVYYPDNPKDKETYLAILQNEKKRLLSFYQFK